MKAAVASPKPTRAAAKKPAGKALSTNAVTYLKPHPELPFHAIPTGDPYLERAGLAIPAPPFKVLELMENVAYFVATLNDPTHGISHESLSFEARQGMEALTEQLRDAGLLKRYTRRDGSIGIW